MEEKKRRQYSHLYEQHSPGADRFQGGGQSSSESDGYRKDVKEIENTYFLIGKVEMTPIFSLKITQILENFLKISWKMFFNFQKFSKNYF